MSSKYLLSLDADGLTAHHWQDGVLREESRFEINQGTQAFSDYLNLRPHAQFYLLADQAEEAFVQEAVPFVRGSDRSALIAHKLQQHFYGTPLTTAVSLGRETEGRRDEILLFFALTRPEKLDPWLNALQEANAQLAGLWTPPLIAPAVMQCLEITPPEHSLLLTLERAGIRQCFFDKGQLHFSRLSARPDSLDPELMAHACQAESASTLQYLQAQRMIARDAKLAVLLPVHPAEIESYTTLLPETESFNFQIINLHTLAKCAGLSNLPDHSLSDALYLQLLAKRTPDKQFAPDKDRRMYRLARAKQLMLKTGAAFLSVSVLAALGLFAYALQLRSDIADMREEIQYESERYAGLQRNFPPLPVEANTLKTLVGAYEQLNMQGMPPEKLLSQISTALEAAPSIDLVRMEWQTGGQLSTTTDATASLRMEAVLPISLTSDPREQLARINAFATALRAQPNLQVNVTRVPVDIASGKVLRSDDQLTVMPTRPQFSMEVLFLP